MMIDNTYKVSSEIVLPDGWQFIDFERFYKYKNLKKVKLPNTILHIDDRAFCECSSLEEINIPEGATIIRESAFSGCTSLENIDLPDSITLIDNYAFENCNSLKSITIPKSIETMGDNVFCKCSSLEDVIISSGVKKVYCGSFCGCINLKNVKLPDSLKMIENSAFSDCSSLENIDIPKNVKIIGRDAFKNCTSLKNINMSDSVKIIGEFCFEGCSSLRRIKLPKNLDVIGCDAFFNCNSLESIDIPRNVMYIYPRAFKCCKSLKEINIYNNRIDISKYAFVDCINLKRIIFHYDICTFAFTPWVEFLDDCYFSDNVKLYNKEDLRIIFKGDKIPFFKRRKIKSMLSKIGYKNVSFLSEDAVLEDKDTNEDIIDNIIENSQIKELINKIDNLCSKLSDNLKDSIQKKKNDILKLYDEELKKENSVDSYSLTKSLDTSLTLNCDGMALINLEVRLNSLYNSLYKEKSLLQILNKINSYEGMLSNVYEKYPDNTNDINGIITALLFIFNKYGEFLNIDVIGEIKNILTEPKVEYEKVLNNILGDSSIILVLDNEVSPEIKLKSDLSTLLDKVIIRKNKIEKFVILRNNIMSKNCELKYIDNSNDINDMINSIFYLISNILVGSSFNKLDSEFNDILTRYLDKINIILKKDDIENDEYQKLERELRSDIQPFLDKLYNYSLDDGGRKKILMGLKIFLDYKSNNDYVCDEKISVVESYLYDIDNKINNSSLPRELKEKFEFELIRSVNNWVNSFDSDFKNMKVSEIEKYLLKNIASMDVNLDIIMGNISTKKKILV